MDEGDSRMLLDMYFEFSDYMELSTTNINLLNSE